MLADNAKTPLEIGQGYETGRDQYPFRVKLPTVPPDALDTVVALELDGEPEVYKY